MTLLLVVVGGFLGAPLRYFTDRFVQARHDMVFPWGTFTVNVTGSLILGLVAGASTGAPAWVTALVGTGFCGALTTFSTFSFETLRLLEEGSAVEAALNVVASLAVGLLVATGGFLLARVLL